MTDLQRVSRIDRGRITKTERTAQGYLRTDGRATRIGVLVYRDPLTGELKRELRPPEEVTKPDSLATLRQVPITDAHPPQMLNADNTKEYARGYTGETVEMDGDLVLVGGCTVTDAALIGKIDRDEARELSCGYDCNLEITSGVWQGQAYDAIQRNIRYNHLAVVPKGRAGPEVALRLDAAEDVTDGEEERKPMAKVKIGDAEYEMSDEAAAACKAMAEKHAAEQKDVANKLQAATAKMDALLEEKTKRERQDADDKAKNQRQDAAEQITAAVKARRQLERQAEKALKPEIVEKFDSMSDDEIRRAVIVAVQPEAKLDGKDAVYVTARFDAAMEIASERVDSTGALMAATRPVHRQDASGSAYENARAKFVANKGIVEKETK